jgi:trehalose 6-phosphate phosphatase
MISSHLLHAGGLAALARYVTPDTLFAFDLDGTLAPIVEEYSAAQITEPVRATLERLVALASVAVITGRSRRDALSILRIEPQLVIGNHGTEWPAHEYSRNWKLVVCCLKWREQLHGLLFGAQGVEIEFKGESISLHYRKATDQKCTLSFIDAVIGKLKPSPRKIGGKYVVNILPMEAFTKGEAIVTAMNRFGLKRTIFIGDDVTNEEVFNLKNVNLFGIHIGKNDQTSAPYYLNKQSDILGLLNSIVGILEMPIEERARKNDD